MAYLHARAGVCYAGVTYAGLVDRSLAMTIGGTSVTPHDASIRITESLDAGSNRMTFTIQGLAAVPARWSEVILAYSHPTNPRFAGHVLSVRRKLKGFESGISDIIYEVECADYTWLLNLRARVTRRYYSQPANGIVASILRDFTEGGFSPGYLPSSLGDLDIEFTGATVVEALTRIAKACDAYLWVDYLKKVNIATSLPDGNSLTIANASTDIEDLVFEDDGSQLRNRVDFQGGGSEVTTAYVVGSGTLDVAQTSWYATAGGRIRVRNVDGTYTGKSVESGPGSLTGVSLAVDAAPGDQVQLVERREDSTSQTALAAVLGGGHSGIATHELSDGRVGATSAGDRASAEVEFFKDEIRGARYITTNEFARPGKQVVVNLSSQPETISATLLIQHMTTRFDGPTDIAVPFWSEVTAQKWRQDLVGILEQVAI